MKVQEIVLKAEKRSPATKGAIHEMRRQGRVPAIAYGDNEAPVALSVDEKSLQGILHSERGRNALIRLEIEKTSHPVLVKEIQRHPITRALWHVDFHRVSLKQKVETSVPIHVKGEAPGVKLSGGILEHVTRDVRVRCLPTEIPAAIDVDVSTLVIGQGIKAKELKLPEGVELLIDLENIIVNVVSPTILEEPTPAEAAAVAGATATEPEVIKKGKIEEGEEGATPAAGAKPGAPASAKAAAGQPAPGTKPETKKPEGK